MGGRKAGDKDQETKSLLANVSRDEQHDASTPLIEKPADTKESKSTALLISFLFMVVIGLGNKVFNKLETEPMNNYPFFLTFYTSLVYVPLSFAYIWPMIIWGNLITKEQRAIPLHKFAIMGFLDGIAGIMQVFATTFIPNGALIILLTQSAIPISMIISKVLLKIKYEVQHYVGAIIVLCGIAVALVPVFLYPAASSGTNNESEVKIFIWCVVMILSCVPMTLSSVYKEKSLGEQEIDVVYLNGWVAVFQVIVSAIFAIPAAYATGIMPKELPKNFWDGARCYAGYNSILESTATTPADDCHMAPIYVNVYLAFNVAYNILIILILKYGSSNLLWLAMTIMVPLGVLVFSLPFIPDRQAIHFETFIGLALIMIGLVCYRFFGTLRTKFAKKDDQLSNVVNS